MANTTLRTDTEIMADSTLTRDQQAAEWSVQDQRNADRQTMTRRYASHTPLWAGMESI